MRNRLRKIRRLKKYFEQKKNIELLELKKAVAETLRRMKRRGELESQKWMHMEHFTELLEEGVDPWTIRMFESGARFFDDLIRGAEYSLDEARKNESTKRVEAVRAMVEHRVWENLYGRNELRLKRYIEKREELEADEIALMRKKSE